MASNLLKYCLECFTVYLVDGMWKKACDCEVPLKRVPTGKPPVGSPYDLNHVAKLMRKPNA